MNRIYLEKQGTEKNTFTPVLSNKCPLWDDYADKPFYNYFQRNS